MPKKSRSARAQQITKRQTATRPLVATAYADNDENEEQEPVNINTLDHDINLPEDKVERVVRQSLPLRPVQQSDSSAEPDARTAATNRAVSRRIASANASKQQQSVSRQQEYNFIRSDIITVAVLTIIMIILLIALAFILAR
ncbi:hypothetical protein [Candidatus Chlorohelix sp.]|uniref:hypothetical protein n=1 Tax=Candidatus Chlorohelix sp. TaxID=3139201 RepID=UPI003058BF73